MPYVKKYRKVTRRVRKNSGARKATVPFVMRQIAKLNNSRETKTATQLGTNVLFGNYNIGAFGTVANTLTVIPLGPADTSMEILQGVTQNSRIGNKIETKSLKVKAMFSPMYYDATNNPEPKPCVVKVWILTQKNQILGAPEPSFSEFFQAGDTATAPHGNTLDTFLAINKDVYTVYARRTYKVGNSGVVKPGNASGQNSQNFANNDFKLSARMNLDLTKHCLKYQTYNDNAPEPTGRGLFMVIEAVSADGYNYNTGYPVQMSYQQDYKYTDA